MSVVRMATIPAADVFNLTSPRWLPELSSNWHGRLPWHDSRYDTLRSIVERHYVDRFNAVSGHYRVLEESVLREGFRNPVVVTTGKLLLRKPFEIPPGLDLKATPVCEWVGGSRLLVAVKLGMHIPCVVNDYANLFPKSRTLDHELVKQVFRDPPRIIKWRRDGGLYINYFPYSHFEDPMTRRHVRASQTPLRRIVIAEILDLTSAWLKEHDSD